MYNTITMARTDSTGIRSRNQAYCSSIRVYRIAKQSNSIRKLHRAGIGKTDFTECVKTFKSVGK
eukprot:SAG31_NODE_14288_length_816_cov_1.152022_1_plen_63_part_01